MTSSGFQAEIETFRREVGEPVGISAEPDVAQHIVDRVRAVYMPQAIQRDEATKREALKALRAGWLNNQDHGHVSLGSMYPWGQTDLEFYTQEILNRSDLAPRKLGKGG